MAIVHHHDRPLTWVETVEGGHEPFMVAQVLEDHRRIDRVGRVLPERVDRPGCQLLDLPGSAIELIAAAVDQDPVDPGADIRLEPKGMKRSDRPQSRVLNRILGLIGSPEQAESQVEQCGQPFLETSPEILTDPVIDLRHGRQRTLATVASPYAATPRRPQKPRQASTTANPARNYGQAFTEADLRSSRMPGSTTRGDKRMQAPGL